MMENKDLALVWDAIMAPHIDLKWRELSEESRKVYQKFRDALAPKEPEHVTDPSDLWVGDEISAVIKFGLYSSTWRGTIKFVNARESFVDITFVKADDEGREEFSTYSFKKNETKFFRHSKSIATRLKSLPVNTHVLITVGPDRIGDPLLKIEGYTATKTDVMFETVSPVIVTLESVRGSNTILPHNVLDFKVLSLPKDTHNV